MQPLSNMNDYNLAVMMYLVGAECNDKQLQFAAIELFDNVADLNMDYIKMLLNRSIG